MKRTLMWLGAIALAIPGAWLYFAHPGDAAAFVNVVTLMPLGGLVMQAAERRLPSRAQWAFAIALAPIGPVAYVLWDNPQTWFYGVLAVGPLGLLASRREERLREQAGDYPVSPSVHVPPGPP